MVIWEWFSANDTHVAVAVVFSQSSGDDCMVNSDLTLTLKAHRTNYGDEKHIRLVVVDDYDCANYDVSVYGLKDLI